MVRDRLDRKLPGRRFRRQHHRVGAVEDRGRDVGHLGAGRHRARDHAFEHLRRHHHRLAGAARGAGDLLLDARHLFQRHFHAEVAARHHQRVGDVDDLVEPVHRLRLLDLGHHGGAAARDLLGLGDVLGPLDERQRDPVDAGVERGFEIGAVLGRQRRERDHGVGQAHALAVGQLAADLDAGDDLLPARFGRDQADLAVVEQQRVAGLHAREDLRMRQVHARRVAGRGIGVEREGRAVVEHGRARRRRCRRAASVPADRPGCRSAGRSRSRPRGSRRPARACGRARCGSC